MQSLTNLRRLHPTKGPTTEENATKKPHRIHPKGWLLLRRLKGWACETFATKTIPDAARRRNPQWPSHGPENPGWECSLVQSGPTSVIPDGQNPAVGMDQKWDTPPTNWCRIWSISMTAWSLQRGICLVSQKVAARTRRGNPSPTQLQTPPTAHSFRIVSQAWADQPQQKPKDHIQ